uniref:Uncharacterized protein n=1 Tax=Arundo donax TaxID=35708 RepID=A0A0A9HF65_ARUDO
MQEKSVPVIPQYINTKSHKLAVDQVTDMEKEYQQ